MNLESVIEKYRKYCKEKGIPFELKACLQIKDEVRLRTIHLFCFSSEN